MAQETNTGVQQTFSPLIWLKVLFSSTDMGFKPSSSAYLDL